MNALRTALLRDGDLYFVPATAATDPLRAPGLLLVVEKGYLTAPERERIARDLAQGYRLIPARLGDSAAQGRATVYLYRSAGRPISQQWPRLGFAADEPAIFLIKPFEDQHDQGRRPTFHELTHWFVGDFESGSLSEGYSSYVQGQMRPQRANALNPYDGDVDASVVASPYWQDAALLAQIGAVGDAPPFDGGAARDFFYGASWSFVRYLIEQTGQSEVDFVRVLRAQATYSDVYGEDLVSLRERWRRALSAKVRPAPSP
jgi:hypothetical protein